MSQKKHQTSRTPRWKYLAVSLFTGLALIAAIAPPTMPVKAHHSQECSDVFTPLSSFVTDGVAANKNAYIQVQNETGVPWEMLAAIHYRETNFSRSNPANGKGIFQFVNGEGGPYPPGPVDETEFRRQLKFMADKLQDDYVWRGSVPRDRRKLQPNETNMALVKDTLFSYNGRAGVYVDQAEHFGYNRTSQPYEGSPYVMNRFDCPRARMGIITQDFGSMDGIDTRYGAFTIFARLRGDAYWRSLLPFYTEQINMHTAQRRIVTLEYEGQIYVFYYDGLQQVLRMATQDPVDGWQFTILDGTTTGGKGRRYADVGSSISAVVFDGKIHLVYYDKTNGNLRYGWFDGDTWEFLNLDGDPGSLGGLDANLGLNPTITTYRNSLQVFYADYTNGNLRHAWRGTSGQWWFEDLDGAKAAISGREGDVGLFTSATPYLDGLQVFYYDQQYRNLRHAWTTSTHGWKFESLDGSSTSISGKGGDIGISPSVIVYRNSLQLYYYDEGRTNLRHAWTSPSHGWMFEELDGDSKTAISHRSADTGLTSAIAVNNDTTLRLYYYDRTNNNLRHAWTSPTQGWQFLNVDGDPGSLGGQDSDSGIHAGTTTYKGTDQLYYYNRTSGALRHAWKDKNGWHFEDLGPTVIY